MAARMAELGLAHAFLCPQLPASPRAAIAVAQQLIAAHGPNSLSLIGSSLGGYYATWLAEDTGCRAVLLNPAVHAARDLATQIGKTTAYHSNAPFEFRPEYVDELKALEIAHITDPQRYLLLAATGDEILDWREMVAHYPHAHHCIIQGSDHGISEFADYLDRVLAFCGIPVSSKA